MTNPSVKASGDQGLPPGPFPFTAAEQVSKELLLANCCALRRFPLRSRLGLGDWEDLAVSLVDARNTLVEAGTPEYLAPIAGIGWSRFPPQVKLRAIAERFYEYLLFGRLGDDVGAMRGYVYMLGRMAFRYARSLPMDGDFERHVFTGYDHSPADSPVTRAMIAVVVLEMYRRLWHPTGVWTEGLATSILLEANKVTDVLHFGETLATTLGRMEGADAFRETVSRAGGYAEKVEHVGGWTVTRGLFRGAVGLRLPLEIHRRLAARLDTWNYLRSLTLPLPRRFKPYLWDGNPPLVDARPPSPDGRVIEACPHFGFSER